MWLAKATGSLHAISGGRLTLGLGVGGRADDFAAAERPYDDRGRLMDETLELLHRAWAGEPVAGGEFAVSAAGAGRPGAGPGRRERPGRDPPYGPVGATAGRSAAPPPAQAGEFAGEGPARPGGRPAGRASRDWPH